MTSSSLNSVASLTVSVVFFAALREKLESEGLTLDLSLQLSKSNSGTLTVQHVLAQLIEKNPHWQSALNNTSLLIAVNHDMVDESADVNDGDEVAFFPPVTGG